MVGSGLPQSQSRHVGFTLDLSRTRSKASDLDQLFTWVIRDSWLPPSVYKTISAQGTCSGRLQTMTFTMDVLFVSDTSENVEAQWLAGRPPLIWVGREPGYLV